MTKRLLQSTLSLLLAPLLVAQQTSESSGKLAGAVVPGPRPKAVVPKYAEIGLILLETVSSATAYKGQSVRMAVGKDVTFNGAILIPKGAPATGVVAFVRKAVPGKKDGSVSIKPIRVDPPGSRPIKLRPNDSEQDALGDVFLPLLPFCFIGELVAIPFHRKHEAGREFVLGACSESWGLSELTFTSGTMDSEPTPAEIDLNSVCPNGARSTTP